MECVIEGARIREKILGGASSHLIIRSGRLSLSFARNRSELLEAQRLRYQVFAREMGARLDAALAGIDADVRMENSIWRGTVRSARPTC